MFKFRLQRVLEMKQQTEQDAALRLAEARGEEEAALLERQRLELARDQGLERVATAAGAQSIGHLQNFRFLVDRLNDGIAAAEADLQAASAQVQERMEEYSSAYRDRHMLDRLRARALETHRSEEVQQDRKLMDSVALARFLRTRGARPAGGG